MNRHTSAPRAGARGLRRTALAIGSTGEAAAAALELQGAFEVIVLETGADAWRRDQPLRELGIDLDREFAELAQELPAGTRHQRRWGPDTWRLFELCRQMGLDPQARASASAPAWSPAAYACASCCRKPRVRRARPRRRGSWLDDALPENLYLADATLLPSSLGAPHLLTVLALARRVARAACQRTRALRAS